jgi:transcriptional regulator GlxA family with amidase domain
VLAKAGMLDGLRVTTHHTQIELLTRMAPNARVDDSARFHDNGKVLTAAGGAAGIDCALHMVGRFAGSAVATNTAGYMEYSMMS